MISKKSIGKGSIFLFSNILNASIPFLLLPVLTRLLSPSDYGTIAMFTIFLSLTGAFVGLSVHGAINVNYFKLPHEKFAEYIASCLVLLFISAVSVLLIIGIIGPFIETYIGLPYKWMLIAVLVSFFQFLINIQLTIWIVKGKPIQYGCFRISQTAIDATSSLFLIIIVGLLWEGRLIGISIAIVIAGILSIFLLYKNKFLKKPTLIKSDITDALRFGIPLIPHVLGGFAIHSTDRLIISNKLDLAAVGIYMVAMQLGQAMALMSDAFNKVYSPWLMGNLEDKNTNKVLIVKYSYLAMFVMLACGLAWGIIATYALPIFIGGQFKNSADLIWIMCLASAFTGLYYIVTNYIFYAKKTKYLAIITFSCGILNIGLTYILVDTIGTLGAAYSFLSIQIIFFLFTWIASNKAYPMPWFFFLRY